MRKLLVILGIVAFGFAFTACKKECKCTKEGADYSAPGSADTKELCADFEAAHNVIAETAGTPKIKCEFK